MLQFTNTRPVRSFLTSRKPSKADLVVDHKTAADPSLTNVDILQKDHNILHVTCFLLPNSWSEVIKILRIIDKATGVVREPDGLQQELRNLKARFGIVPLQSPTEDAIKRPKHLQVILLYEEISMASKNNMTQRGRIDNAVYNETNEGAWNEIASR